MMKPSYGFSWGFLYSKILQTASVIPEKNFPIDFAHELAIARIPPQLEASHPPRIMQQEVKAPIDEVTCPIWRGILRHRVLIGQ